MPTQMPFEGLLLGAALTVVGLIVSWVVWRRRGASAGLRAVAWSLLPLAFGLIGLIEILASLVAQLVRFFVGLVLDPLAWAGVAVAGLAVVLWITGRLMRRRAGRSAKSSATEPGAAADRRAAPAVGEGAGQKKAPAGADDDFAEIEELLRRRGIG
ncbi:cellulose synthase [Thermobifida halotolerans]|uniref:Cellulose synthase n=1 Tax=Thermobifida halotolerans TaxID=483545 RepID=A0A399G8J6_9ACTN|nr:cellulose synthase [Thermobifida halotolerans]UOE21598.1 cellulose synthase [Thermobifida halotolerans]